jgi:3-hydroxyacyl-CoA dehydrogenase/enoyl-CoA hydratase/3-hydroxybutyryl-CoA epimerase
MSKHLEFTVSDEGIGAICLNHQDKDVNILSEDLLRELASLIERVQIQGNLRCLIFYSAKKDFSLGADISVIKRFHNVEEATNGARQMQQIYDAIENLPIPTICAIHGQCLGGGLELALSCNYRVATDASETKFGFPEIQIGLIPGAGGTQRATKLIGIQKSLDLILTGKRIASRQALKIGLIDKCVHPNILMQEAAKFHTSPKAQPIGRDLIFKLLEGTKPGRAIIHRKALEEINKNTKGFYPAPHKALEAIFYARDHKLTDGLVKEAALFGELAMTSVSKSLIHVFEATTQIKKHPLAQSEESVTPIHTVGVIGSGLMGGGIALTSADKGFKVRLLDTNAESLGVALKKADQYFRTQVSRKRIKAFESVKKWFRISPCLDIKEFKDCELVIEAVPERLGLKQKLIAQIEDIGKGNIIFATNTSAIPIHKIAEKAAQASKVIGLHFFSPVEKMPLLEIVVTDKTDRQVIKRCVNYGKQIGKQTIIVQDGPGFYTTRALAFYLAEAVAMICEGANIEQLDNALTSYGFPVGPVTLMDEVGLDVGLHVLETMNDAFPDRIDVPRGIREVVNRNFLGKKNGLGFYRYEEGKRVGPNTEVLGILESGNQNFASELMAQRCVAIFNNEVARCLEEKVLYSPYDGDVGAIFGLGFPPFLGGPFKAMDDQGLRNVVEQLRAFEDSFGDRFRPCQLLTSMAEKNETFYD